MSELKFKPCPFCGSTSVAVILDSMWGDKVYCENCGAKIETEEPQFPSAITLWNRRATKELNKEQIKKALEEMNMTGVSPIAIRNALALINLQEQRIKELAEENDRLRACNERQRTTIKEYHISIGVESANDKQSTMQ